MFKRKQHQILLSRLKEPRKFIQIISGPRQVGKTTLVNQVLDVVELPFHFINADENFSGDPIWITKQWEIGRLKLKQNQSDELLLIFDEIQKVNDWSNAVKSEWDKDSRSGLQIKVVLLGSSKLLLEKGLSESLVGRFERIPMMHWSFVEMRNAFNFSPNQFVYFGGYPGAAALVKDEVRWRNYIRNGIIEPVISNDILQLNRVNKPALLRRLFEFSSRYSSKIISYNKMLGQFVDAGNTTTLAHYLGLLDSAGLVKGLENYSGSLERTKASSPKLQVLNTAFISTFQAEKFNVLLTNKNQWGPLVESAVGAYLANYTYFTDIQLYYWRKGNSEVDFVLKKGDKIIGIEVKSGISGNQKGMTKFVDKYNPHKIILVSQNGISWEEFLTIPVHDMF